MPDLGLSRRLRSGPVSILALSVCALGGLYSATATRKVDPTLERLAKVSVFAFGGVGFAFTISEGEKDFDAIAARPSAETDFEKLLAIGTPEAKCYALTGILRSNPDKFKVLSLSSVFVNSSERQVTTMRGC